VRKTRHVRAIESEKPVLPLLWDIIQASPAGAETFLQTEYGKPFSDKGFGNWMRARCDEAGLRRCTAHGVRKIGATILAERGATEHQLMSIFDWSTPAQAATYTREANRRRMAQDSMHLLAAPFTFNAETGGLH
jgi:integrase